jgi:hypothetical protein
MSNYEESAKAIETDYRYAPAGMAVASFWGGALVAGLTGFAMSTGIARGIGVPTTIYHGERVLFTRDYVGLYDALILVVVLLTLSVLLGLTSMAAVSKKKDLGVLWKVMLVIPALMFFVTVFIIAVNH